LCAYEFLRNKSVLQVIDLHCSYGAETVLEEVSFEVEKGELCGLFGPNGCGKTTLFRCCLKFLKADRGRVVLDGVDINKLSVGEMAKRTAYVPQEHKPPFPYLVKDIVLMGRTPHLGGGFGISARDKRAASDALKMLGISSIAERPYNTLSGGQRQMVLIARAIAQGSPLVFLDEPTSALDFSNQIKIWRTLRNIARSGVGIVACSHDPNHVAWFCDKVVVLHGKGVLAQGAPEWVLDQEIMDRIYRGVSAVRSVDGVKIVLPSDVAGRAEAP
jgi:iron complex transport system ATP-binding protein